MDTLRNAPPGPERVIVRLPGKSQVDLAKGLEALPGRNAVTHQLPIVDGFSATIDEQGLAYLQQQGAEVLADEVIHLPEGPAEPPPLEPDLDIATKTVHCPELWAHGITGKGIGIAILDSGIAPHADFGDRIIAFEDTVNGREQPYDDGGHGTHVAGIAAGSGKLSKGKYRGAAPDANLVGIKVFDGQGNTDLSHVLTGIQWAVDNRERYNIKVLNISFGTRPHMSVKSDPVAQAVEKATAAGILVCAAAGNSGPWPQTIDTPGDDPLALTVGATVDYRTVDLSDDKVAWFSGSGPTQPDNFTKPDVIAPGQEIISTWNNGRYATLSGTSMATPLVAGCAAMLFQVMPNSRPDDVKRAIMATAKKIRSYDENIQGKGVIWPVDASQWLSTHSHGGEG